MTPTTIQDPTASINDPAMDQTTDNTKYEPDDASLPKNLQDDLKTIVRYVEHEDEYIRKQQLRVWKKNERFWHGLQYLYWDEVANDWVSPVDTNANNYGGDEGNRDGDDGPFYDFVVNIYQSFGEAIISALSSQMPAVRFPPDDADNPDDIVAAKTHDKIADLITRHNSGKIMLLQALLNMWNQGIVACYHYGKADRKYGTFPIPIETASYACPNCSDYTQPTPGQCPNCGTNLIYEAVVSGNEDCPKTRVIWEFFGPLFVKVSYWAKKQDDFGYLLLGEDKPIAFLQDKYFAIADQIGKGGNAGPYDSWEKIGRSPSQYNFSVNDNSSLATERRCWLRPWQYNVLGMDKKESIAELNRLFPDGCYVAFVNDIYAESRNECMDDYWDVGKGKLSQFIHADALGQSMVPLQEFKNIAVNLKLETMEQAIETTYADPNVLNFEDFARHEIRPGMMVPTKPGSKDGRIADGFYSSRPAVLSETVTDVEQSAIKDAQFVTGAQPQLWGGNSDNSNTLGEYESEKQQALQRLSITWSLLNAFWAQIVAKSVKIYVKALAADEKYVVRSNGSYANVWIRKAELTGKVGDVESEGADTFPVSIMQKQALLFKLMGMNNELVNAVISEPDNRSVISEALGFPELKIPQEAQRVRQLSETNQMIERKVPLPIQPDIDDDAVHIDVLTNFLISEAGDLLQQEDPGAFQALMAHLQMHKQNQAANQAAAQEAAMKQQIQVQQVKQAVNSVPQIGSKQSEPENSHPGQP